MINTQFRIFLTSSELGDFHVHGTERNIFVKQMTDGNQDDNIILIYFLAFLPSVCNTLSCSCRCTFGLDFWHEDGV